jgi:hypothetical protein
MPVCTLVFVSALAAQQQQPDLAAQTRAMSKLGFLVGHWSGTAVIVRGPGEPLRLTQTEDVQFKVGGLVLLLEGTGRNSDGQTVFRALATIAYDDGTNKYRFRAYNDGRCLDTDLVVTDNGFTWGFTSGPATVNNTMKLTGGEWIETTEATMGSSPPRRTVEMKLRKQ